MGRWKCTARKKLRHGESQQGEERDAENQRGRKAEDRRCIARKGSKVAKHCVFPLSCGSGGSKSRLAKAAGAEPAGQMKDEKLHTVVARRTFGSENVQDTPALLEAVVVRSTFGSESVQSTSASVGFYFRSCDIEKVHTVVA